MPILLIDLILEDSKAAKQAKSQGLTSMGFGRWGKDGVVTHTTKKGTLVPVKSASNTAQAQDNPDTPEQPERYGSKTGEYMGWNKPGVTMDSVPFEEFRETLPKFTEQDEATADEDEERGKDAIYGSDNWEEVVDTVEKWKWGGDEGKGAWGFEASEREKMFDTINKVIRDTKATVQAPRLYRGIAFESSDAAQRFITQFTPGQSVELPPCGWSPDSAVSMEYGPNNSSQPEISAMVELEAGDSPIHGLATTGIERNMGMEIIQHEVITPGDVKYEVKEITQHTVTRDGRTQTIYKILLKQMGYTNESVTEKMKKYSMLAYMGGNMAMANNIRKAYKKK